jgi:16S rRNA (cytosine967-C5)-methyltransferase
LAKRLGHTIISTCSASKVGDEIQDWPRLDLILVDAPCSNSGVYARRPEARYRLSEESLKAIQGQQCRLLAQAAGLARAETRIVYSTCSLEPEENQEVISKFCQTHPGWVLRQSQVVLPAAESGSQCWHDGGFVAELIREG